MATRILDVARLRQLLDYNQETGVLQWCRGSPGGGRSSIAGCLFKNGYLYIGIDGGQYLAHRLIWLHVYGHWPTNQIDHINGDKLDNRLVNLRDVMPRINNENHRKVRSDNKSSGMTGVSWHIHSRKWRARIWLKGKEYRVGLFDTQEQASVAYVTAKRVMHEGCTI